MLEVHKGEGPGEPMSLYDRANKIFMERYARTDPAGAPVEEIRSRQVRATLEAVEKEMTNMEKRLKRAIEASRRFPVDPNP